MNFLVHTNYTQFKHNHLLLVLTIIVSLIFIFAGSMKVQANWIMVFMFENRYDYPLWFMFFIGWAEIFGAISLWLKRWSMLGALGLTVIVSGAALTHASLGDPIEMAGPAYGLTLAMLLISIYHFTDLKRTET
jgi:uncharacterized membrane protein YphA (DoxX/SURF4 family)